MKILIIAATAFEIQPYLDVASKYSNCDSLVTGVGMVATAFELGKKLQASHYDLLINIGIGGCFDQTLSIGQVVQVTSESMIELGAEDNLAFISIEELGYGKSTFKSPFLNEKPIVLPFLSQREGITVNTVHGNTDSIAKIRQLHPTICIESMEGAAVFFAANQQNIPVIEIRGISNFVEKRNRATWNIPLAIMNSNNALLQALDSLHTLLSKI